MRKTILLLIFTLIPSIHHGQIIADHRVVDLYDDIPQEWINSVKTMLVEMAGESHSSTYNYGANLLEQYDATYQANYFGGTPPSSTTNFLRIGKIDNVGEETYFTSNTAVSGYKSRIATQNNTGNEFDVMAFVWCWDMYYWPPPSGGIDPIHNVRWGGATIGGADGGASPWGLDAGDSVLTGNRVNMDTYLNAVEEFQEYCIDNNWKTKIVFTTGPVDDSYPNSAGTEEGVQRELKHDHIRNFVLADNSRILFDYADILCWNNDGEQHTDTWDDNGTPRIHSQIHPDNEMDYDDSWNIIAGVEDGDHIGEVGSLRIMKAMWWMLARIAGWDGGNTSTFVTEINTNPESYVKINDSNLEIFIKDIEPGKKLSLHNIYGQLIRQKILNDNYCFFDTSILSSGIYIISSESNVFETKRIFIP